MNKKVIYHMLTILLMTMWGLSYFFIDISLREMQPGELAFIRFLIASIVLIFINKVLKNSFKIEKRDIFNIILGSLFGITLYFLFENTAVKYTKISNISIIIATIPILNLISEKIFYKIKFTKTKMFGVFLSFFGIIIIVVSEGEFSFSNESFIGNMLVLLAAMSWVIYAQITYRIKGNYNSLVITMYQAIFGSIFLIPFMFSGNGFNYSMSTISSVMYLSIFCTVLGYFLYIETQKELGAVVVTTYVNVQPIVGILSGYLFLHEIITGSQILGSVVILTGVIIVSLKKK